MSRLDDVYEDYDIKRRIDMSERLKWKDREYGTGIEAKSFTVEESSGDFVLNKNGGFVAVFSAQQSCKKVAQCIWRELGKTKADYPPPQRKGGSLE